jgi:hypothetical protein
MKQSPVKTTQKASQYTKLIRRLTDAFNQKLTTYQFCIVQQSPSLVARMERNPGRERTQGPQKNHFFVDSAFFCGLLRTQFKTDRW